MNPLFNAMGGNAQMGGPMGVFQNFMAQFNQFRSTFQGDPKAEVEKALQSGQISQEQYNRAAILAQQIMQIAPK